MISSTVLPSLTALAKIEHNRANGGCDQPVVEIRPTVGLTPTMPLKPAGTRPDPPVVPSENDA